MPSAIDSFIEKRKTIVNEYKAKIESMLEDRESYDWAEDTLMSIYDFMEERQFISDKQQAAVNKIQQSIYERRW